MLKRRLRVLVSILAAVFVVRVAAGSEVFVVRFDTGGAPQFLPPCGGLVYRDELLFHNSGTVDATVALLGVSNGTASNPQAMIVPGGRVHASVGASSAGGDVATASWAPDPQPPLWVARLDVPDRVQVVSRLLVLVSQPPTCNGFPGSDARVYAGIPMPVVRSLSPAGTPQVHLGTDIGGDFGGAALDGRSNVGIYNAGSIVASATVELRRGCDGSLVESRSAMIPPNTIIQLNGFSEVFIGSLGDTAAFESYVVVTVDQPSLSYVITLSNSRLPLLPVSSAP